MSFDDLSREEKIQFWSQVEARILDLLLSLKTAISGNDKTTIQEFLDHNELGLALDHLSDVLIEEEIEINEGIFTQILELMKKMEYRPEKIEQFKRLCITDQN